MEPRTPNGRVRMYHLDRAVANVDRQREEIEKIDRGRATRTAKLKESEASLREIVRKEASRYFPTLERFYQVVATEHGDVAPLTVKSALLEDRQTHLLDLAVDVLRRAANGELEHYLAEPE